MFLFKDRDVSLGNIFVPKLYRKLYTQRKKLFLLKRLALFLKLNISIILLL